MTENRALSILVHSRSKSGKSWLADTAPAPRLHLDAEGGAGTRFTPSKKTLWDPTSEHPPEPDGSWDTAVVHVRNYQTIEYAYNWLNSGQHQFKSAILDSISEIQQRAIDSLAGANPMKQADWGELLRQVSALIRGFRDFATHPTTPLEAIVMTAMTHEVNGMWRPYVQGQLATRLPFYLDVVGYLFVQPSDNGSPAVRRLLVSPEFDEYEAGERVNGALGTVIDEPNVERMLDTVFGPR